MSGDTDAQLMRCCTSCGKSELDDINLTECDGCDLVRYCSDECKEDHRPQHEAKCKERAAELRDEILFKQSEGTHLGDCPICCLPLPTEDGKLSLYPCCGKLICDGCANADSVRQHRENETCPFCRHPVPKTNEEADQIVMKRVEANDPKAIRKMGARYFVKEEYDAAFEYFTRTGELGDADAHYLSCTCMGMVLRRMRRWNYTIWKKQPFEATLLLDTILDVMK